MGGAFVNSIQIADRIWPPTSPRLQYQMGLPQLSLKPFSASLSPQPPAYFSYLQAQPMMLTWGTDRRPIARLCLLFSNRVLPIFDNVHEQLKDRGPLLAAIHIPERGM